MQRTPFFKILFHAGGGPVLSVPFERDLKATKVYGWNLPGKSGLSLYKPSYGLQFPARLGVLGDLKNLQSLSLPLGILFRRYANHFHNNMVNKLREQSL